MVCKSIGITVGVPYVGAMLGAMRLVGLLAQNRIKAGWNTDKPQNGTITPGLFNYVPALLANGQFLVVPTTAGNHHAIILFGFQRSLAMFKTLQVILFGKKKLSAHFQGFAGWLTKNLRL